MSALEKLGDLAKPVLKAGALLTWELVRGGVLTLVLVFGVLAWVYPVLSASGAGFAGGAHTGSAGAGLSILALMLQPAGLVLLLLLIVIPFLYAMMVQKRAVARAANTLFKAHGEAIYDRTVGRFVSKQLGEQPGQLMQWIAKPNAFANRVGIYLDESEKLPKIVRRVAKHFASSFVESSELKGLVQNGKVVDAAQVRDMALVYARDSLAPSWKPFLIVLALHLAIAITAVVWFK